MNSEEGGGLREVSQRQQGSGRRDHGQRGWKQALAKAEDELRQAGGGGEPGGGTKSGCLAEVENTQGPGAWFYG